MLNHNYSEDEDCEFMGISDITENTTLHDLFEIESLMDDISISNIDLIEILERPQFLNEMIEILLNPKETEDEYEKYKVPYLTAQCMTILSIDGLSTLFKNDTVFDSVFKILFNPSTSDMYLGYFEPIFSSIVKSIPDRIYTYLNLHRKSILHGLTHHLHRLTLLEITRYLLDIPLQEDKPWWENSHSFVLAFLSELSNEESAFHVRLFFESVIFRGTSIAPSNPANSSSLLLTSLLTPEFLNGLLEAVQTTRSERVMENGLVLFARLLWKEVPTESYGLGGYDSIMDTRTFYEMWKSEGVLPRDQCDRVVQFLAEQFSQLTELYQKALEGAEQTIPGMQTGLRYLCCPKCILRTTELFAHLAEVSSESMLKPLWEKMVELELAAVEKFAYCTFLHNWVRSTFLALMKLPALAVLFLQSDRVEQFVSTHGNSPNLCLRSVARLILQDCNNVFNTMDVSLNLRDRWIQLFLSFQILEQQLDVKTCHPVQSIAAEVLEVPPLVTDVSDLPIYDGDDTKTEVAKLMKEFPELPEPPALPAFNTETVELGSIEGMNMGDIPHFPTVDDTPSPSDLHTSLPDMNFDDIPPSPSELHTSISDFHGDPDVESLPVMDIPPYPVFDEDNNPVIEFPPYPPTEEALPALDEIPQFPF